jgi:hypothetical protein
MSDVSDKPPGGLTEATKDLFSRCEIMGIPLENKSTLEDIRKRFDSDVDHFSNLETGQTITIDAPLAIELISQAAVSCTESIRKVLDIGCAAGNNTLKLLQFVTPLIVTSLT